MISKNGIRARVASARLAERRSLPRMRPERGGAECQVVSVVGGQFWQIKLRDLSASGVSLSLADRLEPDTLLIVELRNRNGSWSCTVLAWVVHVSTNGKGGWLVGCHFTQELATDELERVLS